MGLYLIWLERTPDKREVGGSSPLKPTYKPKNNWIWGISSVGRAPALQAGGHEFESRILHLDAKALRPTVLSLMALHANASKSIYA